MDSLSQIDGFRDPNELHFRLVRAKALDDGENR
jgi:hypothetical protein